VLALIVALQMARARWKKRCSIAPFRNLRPIAARSRF